MHFTKGEKIGFFVARRPNHSFHSAFPFELNLLNLIQKGKTVNINAARK